VSATAEASTDSLLAERNALLKVAEAALPVFVDASKSAWIKSQSVATIGEADAWKAVAEKFEKLAEEARAAIGSVARRAE